MTCPVAESIAIHADEPEQRSISEILSELLANDKTWVDGAEVELHEITSHIDIETLREAVQQSVQGDSLVIYELYIKTLEEFLND